MTALLNEVIDGPTRAEEAGLNYVDDGVPGFHRVRRGRGFSYHAPDGEAAGESEVERFKSLAVPPAWREVWIAADPDDHIQATGYDSAGRKQYIYHPAWEEIRDEIKFQRLGGFGNALHRLRRRVDADLRLAGLPRSKVVALAVAVLDRTLIRVGNREYASENESYGLTTLTCDHVDVNGQHVHLEFEGKGGAGTLLVFKDRRLAELIGRCQALSAETLFSYEHDNGATSISSADVNSYLADIMGGPFTAKDFRTWGATTIVTRELAGANGDDSDAALLDAIDIAAETLGNTRAVCRSSYLHPAIPDAYLDGALAEAWRRARPGKWIDRAESAVKRLVDPG
ncbi:MAG: DNA topoisomerase IB [Acidimicrobiia bacterium]